MDYMKEERDRGITIRSACITFKWEDYQINLIDTPGHIDFNAEVERSLRVLDGAVVVIDGVSGVETQSETVWRQADKFEVSRIVFINKMDRMGASLEDSIQDIKDRLKVSVLQLQSLIMDEERIVALIDLVGMKRIEWIGELGDQVKVSSLQDGDEGFEEALVMREELLEELANYDEVVMEKVLEGEAIGEKEIKVAVRNAIREFPNDVVAVMCGR